MSSLAARAQLYAEGEVHRLQGELLVAQASGVNELTEPWTTEMWLRLMRPVIASAFAIGYAAAEADLTRQARRR